MSSLFGRRQFMRLLDIQADYFERTPIVTETAESRNGRRRLQAKLGEVAKVMPAKFSKFERDGRKAY
ncbi:MAG: hypothetical protein JNK87_06355 [Bryobacterales bacterium]|nr:hypothetical protein [Bryobacterales bacterium]